MHPGNCRGFGGDRRLRSVPDLSPKVHGSFEDDREIVSLDHLVLGDDRDPVKKGVFPVPTPRLGMHEVERNRAPGTVAPVPVGPVHRVGVVEGALAGLDDHGLGLELGELRGRQDRLHALHVLEQGKPGQEPPLLAPRDVLEAAVLDRGVVEHDVAGDVPGGIRSRPIGVILMPGHDARVPRRLVKHLVMPEPDPRGIEELRNLRRDRRVPEEIMEGLLDEPHAQNMEDVLLGVVPPGLIDLVQLAEPGVLSAPDPLHRLPERPELGVVEHAPALHGAVLLKEPDLLGGKLELGSPLRGGEEIRYRSMNPLQLFRRGLHGASSIVGLFYAGTGGASTPG